jgi:nitroreductase
MMDFRPRFGVEVARGLCGLLLEWEQSHGTCTKNEQVASAYSVLQCYKSKHLKLGVDTSDIFENFESVFEKHFSAELGGVKLPTRITAEDGLAFKRVITSRSSIRWFDGNAAIDSKLIEDATSLAISTPSVCNRQTWRVHSYTGEEIQKLLECQNGNRGFGQQIPMLLVVTSDLSYFTGPSERNQAWVDGGMFAMSLALALHSIGLGSVCLNWCTNNKQDKALRSISGISDEERIIMLIGVGYPRFDIPIPYSIRRPYDTVLTQH